MRLINLLRSLAVMMIFVFTASNLVASEATPMAKDPVLEAKVMAVSYELRCLVCQNQTIADSDAELAVDLRNQVREMLLEGKEEDEIVDYMVERYGDFVRYRPPVKPTTYLLWFGPFILFAVGLLLLIVNIRKRRQNPEMEDEESLSSSERSRVDELLKHSSGENNK